MDLPHVSDILTILYPNSLDYVKDEDLDRGRYLHEQMEIAVNDLIHGHVDEAITVPHEIAPVMQWLKRENITFWGTETKVSHEYGFQGHPDLLGLWKQQDYCFDYKFAETITEMNRMQMTAYIHMTRRKGAFIQCKRDGTVIVQKQKPEPQLWAAFLSGLQTYKFIHRKERA